MGNVAADPMGFSNPAFTFYNSKSPLFVDMRQIWGENERRWWGGELPRPALALRAALEPGALQGLVVTA